MKRVGSVSRRMLTAGLALALLVCASPGGMSVALAGAVRASAVARGDVDPDCAVTNGNVYVIAPDGSGGVYIGGEFTQVNNVTRNSIAHVLANGTLDAAFNPNANGAVEALAVSGSTVYAGGGFSSIGGQTRNNIAALDASTGNATAWNPGANGAVEALAVFGSTVYAGGGFTFIGGQTRNRIAALDASTGNATAWNPNANEWVSALGVSGSTVYAGGSFTFIGGQTRNRIAALDASTGNATAWNPNADERVDALALSGSTLYVGGNFTNVGGQSLPFLARFPGLAGDTSITIKTNATSTKIGKTPILSGSITPNDIIGKIIVVYVKKPGKSYWSYSSNRVAYSLYGNAAWQYKYFFKRGMAKGVYTYKAAIPAYPGYAPAVSPTTVSIRVK
jgi:hypothetical protein